CLAVADGGRILLSGSSGGLLVTVFAAPSPLRVGIADLSVLVQETAGASGLDAPVTLDLSRIAEPRSRVHLVAPPGPAPNRLLYAARAERDEAGPWRIAVAVDRGVEEVAFETTFEVAPAATPVARYWPWLAIVPIVVTIFLLHQRLRDRQAARGPARPS